MASLLATLLLCVVASVAGCADPSPTPPPSGCNCNLGETCIDNTCVLLCSDGVCPAGKTCIEGMCRPEVGCASDVECGPGMRCVEGGCFANECTDGETRECSTSCGTGTEFCRGHVWRGCDAQISRLEVCGDDVDNDCDGTVDEDCAGCTDGQERACQTECGAGSERCVGSEWRGCTAERPRFEICGDGIDNNCDGTIDEQCDGCADGETRVCSTDCGEGQETCIDATWAGCTAQRPVDEVCDGVDNDCDGQTDEEIVRDCTNACGPGTESCNGGSWTDCTAPQQCACNDANQVDQQICGTCGYRTRNCVSGSWSQWSACEEAGVCNPGAEDSQRCGLCGSQRRVCNSECAWGEFQACLGEGACEVGQVQTEECGGCGGQRSRTCDDNCTWGEWGECNVPASAACSPGSSEDRACEMCGTETRTCTNACEWGEWGACQSGACEPGEEDARPCGSCRVELRTCGNDCQWGDWGQCLDQGQCTGGQNETGPCGNCGTRTRFCTADCIWGDWTFCTGEGDCAPAEVEEARCGTTNVGSCEYGQQVRTCDAQCQWNDWGSCLGAVEPAFDVCGDGIDQDCDGADADRPDSYEPNDTCNTAYDLGEEPDGVEVVATIDTASDTNDYYKFTAIDGVNWGLPERIYLDLVNIPSGADFDLYLYQGVTNCLSSTALDSSTLGSNQDESIQWQEDFASGDDGVYYVRVKRFTGNSCSGSYTLTVTGLR